MHTGAKKKSEFQKKLLSDLKKDHLEAPEAQTGPGMSTLKKNKQATILIVDDEPSTLEFLSTILSRYRLNIIVAQSVKQAKKCLISHPETSMIICDLRMPEEDGFVLLNYLKTNVSYRHIPVIVSSSFADEEVVKQAIASGAVEYVNKPFTKELMIARIKSILDTIRSKILLVSDDKVISTIFKRALGHDRYYVHSAENGVEAIKTLGQKNINVIISELALVDMTGFDFMQKVCDLGRWIPILFLSDPQLQISEGDIIKAGGQGVISRPFNNLEIRRKMETLACYK
jgi:CheY-like chemotaxis protein